ncbi:MAG: hypothetical protein RI957_671 [Verrucomicrobiota bacterium]|jgi:hypothetical protein
MGNERWILHQLQKRRSSLAGTIVEWGAGDGELCRKIHQRFPQYPISGIDFLPNPCDHENQITWRSGNLLEMQPHNNDRVIIANLFLHHLTDEELRGLGIWIQQADLLIISEPLRKKSSHTWGKILHPILHEVTRHDMHVSIDAGFVSDELSTIWSDNRAAWVVEEWEQWPGAYRSVWRRK